MRWCPLSFKQWRRQGQIAAVNVVNQHGENKQDERRREGAQCRAIAVDPIRGQEGHRSAVYRLKPAIRDQKSGGARRSSLRNLCVV
jgi:hypothetical protein